MIISCFPTGIVNKERPGQGIADISHAGFESLVLDMSMYSEAFIQKCQGYKVEISVVYAPYLPRDTREADKNEKLIRDVVRSIQVCGEAGGNYIVIRPLFAGVTKEDIWKVNKEYYLQLAETAREYNVTILLENQCQDVGGHLVRGICADGDVASEWIDMLNDKCGEERFGFCMDTGVCSLCGQDMYEIARTLGRRLKMVCLRECDGQKEASMLPFTAVYHRKSQMDWLNLLRGLREISFDGVLALSIEDTAAAFSPLLRPQLLQLAKSVVEYFKWQIELEKSLKKYKSIVLFGAGNMCRNFMKCYGEKYVPMFTCDNNSKLWGTTFCGLEVKPPEQLKELPPDCAIFICNIYYREIEKQLRDMDIKNPIEFFNDEYMPSFYFDRLKSGGE